MTAWDKQIGGFHYVKFAVQPMLFGTINRYDPALYAIFTYVLRHGDKGHAADLDKAIHCVELREDLRAIDPRSLKPTGHESPCAVTWRFLLSILAMSHPNPAPASLYRTMSMDEFCVRNGIADASLLRQVDRYGNNRLAAKDLIAAIRTEKDNQYGRP